MSLPLEGIPGTIEERTFIAIKPDGVQRGLVGTIIGRFENKGYKLVGMKMVTPTKEFAATHYADLSSKSFFNGLVEYFSSGPVVALIFEGEDAILGGRRLVGATDPKKSAPGTIRGDFCIQMGRNIIHGSDGPEAAKNELNLWFGKEGANDYESSTKKWVYE